VHKITQQTVVEYKTKLEHK